MQVPVAESSLASQEKRKERSCGCSRGSASGMPRGRLAGWERATLPQALWVELESRGGSHPLHTVSKPGDFQQRAD